jgi:hypothetical protein
MRNVILPLVLALAGVVGLASAPVANAYDSGRIHVGIGDVTFSYGRPYYRHNHEPLYVVYERGYPRYYRAPPPRHYAPVRDYRYGYRDHRYRDYRHHGHHRGHDRDRHHGRRHRGWN